MHVVRSAIPSLILALAVVAGLAVAGVPVCAAAVTPDPAGSPYDAATTRELQTLITKQLDAFNRADAPAAESFATPQFRDKYPDPATFFAMVKENYAPLFKPRSTHFEDISDSPHGPLQKMTVVAADGTVWTAVYIFERISGEWRISGCGLMKQDGQDI
ncbi:DUF4864 domain-containing protein [Beijerinckia sp. L45]|uniref:DUF4864 domain-containing protein n=1 Tax=Beijerinckia sp. L45 TaxID=1641855 RepID=UPI00131CE3C3|nr:DUF4864 domain-containing protein [Beijerinckia sp. L45]